MKQSNKNFETVPLKEVLKKVQAEEKDKVATEPTALKATSKEEPYSVPYSADADHPPANRIRKRAGLS